MIEDQKATKSPSKSTGILLSISSTLKSTRPSAIPRKVPNTPSVVNTLGI